MPRSIIGRTADGLQYSGFPLEIPQTGSVYYVYNGSALPRNGIAGSDGNDGKTPELPKATLAGAMAQCKSGRGDTIVLMAGHAETLAAAYAPTITGVKIIGLGSDLDRPVYTLATSAAACIKLPANSYLRNVLFVDNVGVTAAVVLAGTGVVVDSCEVRDGSSSPTAGFSVLGGGANLADKCKILNCKMYSASASEAVLLGEVDDAVEVMDCDFNVSASNSVIHNPTGKILTNLRLERNICNNLGSGYGIRMVSAVTGVAVDNKIQCTTNGQELSASALDMVGNMASNGANSASFAVPANVSNSVVSAVAGSSAQSGVSASKLLSGLYTSGALFTVTGGPIQLVSMMFEVAGTVFGATATTLQVTSTDTASSTATTITGATTVTSAAIGTLITMAATALSTAMQVNAGGTALGVAGENIGIIIPVGAVSAAASASNTGAYKLHLRWIPLSPTSVVTIA